MNFIWKYGLKDKDYILNRYKEIKQFEPYVSISIMMRDSIIWVEFYNDKKEWIGYAALELLEFMNVGLALSDIEDEVTFEKWLEFVKGELSDGYYMHVFRIFEKHQERGYGKKAENKLFQKIRSLILLYTVAESESFWLHLGYGEMDNYYMYKKYKKEDKRIAS